MSCVFPIIHNYDTYMYTVLRKELENEILKHKETLARVQKSHLQQIQSLQSQYNLEKSALTSQLRDQHSQECLALQQANQLAVNSLREKMESEKRDLLALTNDDHMEQRRLLEERLREQFSRDMAHVQGEHLAEIERFRQQIGSVVSQSQQQVSSLQCRIMYMYYTLAPFLIVGYMCLLELQFELEQHNWLIRNLAVKLVDFGLFQMLFVMRQQYYLWTK